MPKNLIDTILYNGHIRTLDDAQPVVTALAISGGRIVACGSDAEVRALAGPGTTQLDLGGRYVLPGMTDAHVHWEMTTEMLHTVQLYNLPSRAVAVERVAARAAATPAGEWITGYGWAQDDWDDRRFPTAADLDAVTPDNPVFLQSRSCHAGWVNRVALRLCGIDASTPDPDGGEIARDAASHASHGSFGEPTGLLVEPAAMALVKQRIPAATVETLATQMKRTQAVAHSMGITGIHDFDDQECFSALQIMRERGDLGLRVVKNFNKKYLDAVLKTGLRRGFGDDWIRWGGLKLFADGALGPRTAAMIAPYEGEPENRGIVVIDKEEMVEMVSRASANGFASTIHAIGDRAVHDVLDVYEQVRREEAARGEARSTRRHRIEHVQLIHPDDVNRLAELDIIASMQPIHATSDYLMADRYWGERAAVLLQPALAGGSRRGGGVRVGFAGRTAGIAGGHSRGGHAPARGRIARWRLESGGAADGR